MDEPVMTVLAAETELSNVFTGRQRGEHEPALRTLAAHFDKLIPGLRKALGDSCLSSRGVGGCRSN